MYKTKLQQEVTEKVPRGVQRYITELSLIHISEPTRPY